MTKCLEIYPEELFKKGEIDFTPIAVNAYSNHKDAAGKFVNWITYGEGNDVREGQG